ncbi:MAG: GAF domain-containing protein [Acidimicrobiales bacterium]
MLEKIVESARDLIGARYAALGVLGASGLLSDFVTVGVSDKERELIGQLPSGKGVLGNLIHDPQPLRLDDLSKSPDSCGFPPNHPPMRTFLGVPVMVRGGVFGNLYLTEKFDGAASFTDQDEEIAVALAAAAGVAIENSRLYERSERQRRWAEASATITSGTLQGATPSEVRSLAVHHAAQLGGADETGLRVPTADGEALVLAAGVGDATEANLDKEFALDSLYGSVYERAEALCTGDLAAEPGGFELAELLDVRSMVAVPLRSGDRVLGVLSVSRRAGQAAFTAEDLEPLEVFGTHVALALEYAASSETRERVLLLEERDRIARDLHDLVIQRLFATGMALQSIEAMGDNPRAEARIASAVDELDATIRDIRSTIFSLRQDRRSPTLRGAIAEILNRSRDNLGLAPRLHVHGELDARVPPEITEDVQAVLTEALANAARHAAASMIDVTIEVDAQQVSVQVADNGKGIPSNIKRTGGLQNLADRAYRLDGRFTIEPRPSGGTRLQWSVPLLR